MKKKIFALLLAVLMTAAGCGNSREPNARSEGRPAPAGRVVTDALGRQVELPNTVETFVALGNTPRMAAYLGLAGRAAGVGGMEAERVTPLTAYAYVNREVWKDLPAVGTDASGNTDYYPEVILEAAPDVILCTYTEDIAEDLDKRTAGIPEEEKPSVLSAAATFKGVHGIEGVSLKNPVLDAIHAHNAASGSAPGGASAAEVDREQILSWDPDYIFCDYGGVALVKQDAAENPEYYGQLQAYREGRIFQHPSSTSYFSNLELSLANCYYIGSVIYPEQFADIDAEAKANEIIQFLLGAENYMSVLRDWGAACGPVDFGV